MRRSLPAVVAVLAVLALLPRSTPSDAGSETPVPWRCGTEVTPEVVAAFEAREAQFGPLVIPQNALPAPYCVPIAAHIVRTSSGTGGLSLDRLNQGIADCNTAYVNTGIKFLLLSVDYIDDDDYYYNIDTDAEIDAMIQENVVAEAINVYFTPNLENEDGGLCGRGSFTTSSPQGVAMNNGCTGTSDNPSTFPHEIGHFLDLFHTHETAFGAELVDGSNCGSAGDKLCDTPADPGLDEGTNIDANCNYYGSETDANDDPYNPDTHQLMSYAPKLCRDVMSPQSEAKVVATLLNLRSELLNRGCAPTADAGADITAECTSPTTTPVQLDGTGSSDPEGDDPLTYAWSASGVTFDDATLAEPTGEFSFGTTTVELIVFNGAYSDTDYVDVTIEDTTGPVVVCPADIVVECSSHCGVAEDDTLLIPFFNGVSATDVCDDDVEITNDAPDCFPLGETTVTFTAEDDDGNTSQCTAKVTVEDTTPPEIDVVLDRDVLWPPNHKLAAVCAEVTVTDICDPEPTWVLFGAVSDEPANALGDGDTDVDIVGAVLGTADECIELRSERMGGEDGRKYTIYYQASDESGNTAYDTVCVRVPHDQSSAALASTGFSLDGKTLTGADKFAVVIPTSDKVDASELEVSRIYLGNTAGVIRPAETRVVDVNADGRLDLALFYQADTFGVLVGASSSLEVSGSSGTSLKRERGDGPLGIHYTTRAGVDYLVGDIFALGTPVEMPSVWLDITPPLDEPEEKPAVKATALTSIHPNPFNPQTTVAYTLLKSERVRIAIYDVRGSLVRRLVDESRPAGEHRAVWTGDDDAGRPVTSGIYFVRMIAGSTTETRKIVMLK